MKKGIFITFEGPEGSGKSTHIQRLASYLRNRGHRIRVTREPGGTPLSTGIRAMLLHGQTEISPLAELFLYETDRAQHVAETIRPALDQGAIVLCDRFTDSTAAYQGYGRRLSMPVIDRLNKAATQGLAPDFTILLDVPAARGLRQAHRAKRSHDRLEKAGAAFHQRVRKGFLALARRYPRRIQIIPQQARVEETQRLVREAVDRFLKRA